MNKRDDAQYEIESLSKGLAVFEALEGPPLAQKRIEQRTQLSRDTVMRSLRTLRLRGYAIQNERGEWHFGPRVMRLSNDLEG